jgi:hypothetical protein
MNEPNADDRRHTGHEEGFTMLYRCGDYRTSLAFCNGGCHEVVSNVVSFLLGCGFSPNNIIDCMAENAENLEVAWFTPRGAAVDKEMARKWGLEEET